MEHSPLLKWIILKFNSSSIALLTMYISLCCHNRVLYWVYTDPYRFIYWAIRENIAQLPDQYGQSTLPILPYQEGQDWKYTFRNWECQYYDSSRDIRWNIAWALGKSLGLLLRDFPRAQAISNHISLLSSWYRYSPCSLGNIIQNRQCNLGGTTQNSWPHALWWLYDRLVDFYWKAQKKIVEQ